MKNKILILLFLVVLGTTLAKRRRKPDPKVNVALETAFIFDPKDLRKDMSLIKSMRSYLDQLESALLNTTKLRTTDKKHYVLSEFLYDLGKYVLNYNESNVRSFVSALQEVIEDYYPEGTALHKVIKDKRLKAFLRNSITEWNSISPIELKKKLLLSYNGTSLDGFNEFMHDIDEFFTQEDCLRLAKLSKKFKEFRTPQKKLVKLIEKSLNWIVFNRFTHMDKKKKKVLTKAMLRLADYLEKNHRDKITVLTATSKRSFDDDRKAKKRSSSHKKTKQEYLNSDSDKKRAKQESFNSDNDQKSVKQEYLNSDSDLKNAKIINLPSQESSSELSIKRIINEIDMDNNRIDMTL